MKEIYKLFELANKAFQEKKYEDTIETSEKIIDIYNKDFVLYSDERYIIYNIEIERNRKLLLETKMEVLKIL